MVLGSLALIAPASSVAKKSVSTSTNVGPSCGVVEVSGSWTPVSDQAYVDVEVSDNQAGLSASSALIPVAPDATMDVVDLGDSFTPVARGKHVLKVTFTVYDADLNPLVSGKDNANMSCALSPVILPT